MLPYSGFGSSSYSPCFSRIRRALPSKICRKGSALQIMPSADTSLRSSAMVWSPEERPSPRAAARSTSTALPLRVRSYFRAVIPGLPNYSFNSLREEQGTDALRERLGGMGKAVGRQVAARLAGVKDKRERIRALASWHHARIRLSIGVDRPGKREMAGYRGDQLCFSQSRQMLSGSLPLRSGHDVRSRRLRRSSR